MQTKFARGGSFVCLHRVHRKAHAARRRSTRATSRLFLVHLKHHSVGKHRSSCVLQLPLGNQLPGRIAHQSLWILGRP
jgi:hypothetical protein